LATILTASSLSCRAAKTVIRIRTDLSGRAALLPSTSGFRVLTAEPCARVRAILSLLVATCLTAGIIEVGAYALVVLALLALLWAALITTTTVVMGSIVEALTVIRPA
jgi:hypothetical protein